jgi:hypothetical protein
MLVLKRPDILDLGFGNDILFDGIKVIDIVLEVLEFKYEKWVENKAISLQMEYIKKFNLNENTFDEDKFWDWTMEKWLQTPEESYFEDYNPLLQDLIWGEQ